MTKTTNKRKLSGTLRNFYRSLEQVYFNPLHHAGFGSKQALLQSPEVKAFASLLPAQRRREAFEEWLRRNRTYTLHRQLKHRFLRRRTVSQGPEFCFEIDLADFQQVAKYNDGYRYLLNCIDTFSRRADSRPIKNKTPGEVLRAFQYILYGGGETWGKGDGGRFISLRDQPYFVYCDQGNEFKGEFQAFLKEKGIVKILSYGEFGASIVERFTRTLKDKLYRYFTHANSFRYIEVLPKLIKAYNNRFHSAIKMAPNSVTLENLERVRQNLYGIRSSSPLRRTQASRHQIGDTVRVSKERLPFRKGYLPQQSEEVFTIIKQTPLQRFGKAIIGPEFYTLRDSVGQEILGRFYRDELIRADEPKEYLVERVISEKRDPLTRKRSFLVKWLGFPDRFNSWVSEDNIRKIKNNNDIL